jgi:hypothetical protein
MPLDSHAPRFPGLMRKAAGASGRLSGGSTSVGPSSADWFTLATTSGDPENGTHHSRAVVAFALVSVAANCWLDPGSSVTRRPFAVDSRLSGWWISPRVLTLVRRRRGPSVDGFPALGNSGFVDWLLAEEVR